MSISVSPFALLDVYNGASYKAGLTYRPFSYVRFTADGGGYWPQLTKKLTLWNDMKGYNFRTSLGLFFGYLSEYSLGLEYQYKTQSFNYNDSVPSLPEFNAQVDKEVHVFNIYGAYDLWISNRIYLELRCGLGVRYRDIFNTRSDDVSSSVYWRDSMNQGRITTTKSIMPNLNFAVRLNYTFWRY